MPVIGETLYSFSAHYPRVLERGRANLVRMPVYRDGAAVTPSVGSYTLWKPDGVNKVVDAAAATIASDNVAEYSIPSGSLPSTLELGEGYLEEWALTLPDGTTRHPRRPVALARKALDPPVTDADLEGEYPDLSAQRGSLLSSYQSFLDAAWSDILRRLTREGVWSYLVVGSEGFFEVQRELALHKIYRFFHSKMGGNVDRYKDLYLEHARSYDRAWRELAPPRDSDHDGRVDDPTTLRGVVTPLHVNAPPSVRVGGRYGGRF